MRLSSHPFSLRQLQYVVAVADRKSFRRAAEDCHVAQPSLSTQIAQVEAGLGVALFERDKRRVSLTVAGAVWVEQARAILIAADDLTDAARTLSDPLSGELRIGIIPTVGPYFLPEVAPRLQRAFPKLRLLWTEEKTQVLSALLERGELDAAIVALEKPLSELPHLVLGQDAFVFAAAPDHPLAASRAPLRADALDGQRVLVLDDGHCFRDQALSFCTRAGAHEASYRATSLATLVQMTAGGAGVTLLPALALPLENRRRALAVRPFVPRAPSRTLALVWRKSAALAIAQRAVAQALHAAYAELLARASAKAASSRSSARSKSSRRAR